MSTAVVLNTITYHIPNYRDTGYAQGSGNLSQYLVALATGVLTKAGGAFTLTADANFGGSFGLIAFYLKSASASIASSGVIRLANSDPITWRNSDDSDNMSLTLNGANQLQLSVAALSTNYGLPIIDGTFTQNHAAVWGANTGLGYPGLTNSVTTATELSYVSGVTSSIQTQINSPSSTASINGTFIGLGRNRVVNGECLFDQIKEGGVYTAGIAAHYTLDQWRCEATGTPNFTIQRSSTAPTGFQNSILFTTNTSGSPGASDGCNIEQVVEGPYIRDFNYGTAAALTLTFSFWVRASITGTYSISFLNQAANRAYVSTYVVNSANTFEKKTVTFVGDITGTWVTTPGSFGMKIVWDAGSGSSVTTSTLNSWQAGGLWKATGSVSLVANAGATLYITGAQLEIGSVATSFEYVPYLIGWNAVKRYVYKTFNQGVAPASAVGYAGAIGYIAQQPGLTTGGSVLLSLPVEMNPQGSATLTYYNPIVPASATWYNSTQSTSSGTPTTLLIDSRTNLVIQNPQVAGDAGGNLMYVHLLLQSQIGGP